VSSLKALFYKALHPFDMQEGHPVFTVQGNSSDFAESSLKSIPQRICSISLIHKRKCLWHVQ